MFNEDELLNLKKLMIKAEFELYDSQPEPIRYIMREYGVSVEMAKAIYKKECNHV